MIGIVTATAAVVAPSTGSAVAAAMAASAAGWNAGDLDRFMAIYADDAVYVTGKGVVRGKPAIAARYRPSFAPGGNRRGRLSFRPLFERMLGPAHRLLVAQWTLTGATVETGMTTLVFARRDNRWLIVSDHSS